MASELLDEDYETRQRVFLEIVAGVGVGAEATFSTDDPDMAIVVCKKEEDRVLVANDLKKKWPFNNAFKVSIPRVAPVDTEKMLEEALEPVDGRMVALEDALKQGIDKDVLQKSGKFVVELSKLVGHSIVGIEHLPPSSLLIKTAQILDGSLIQSEVKIDLEKLEVDLSKGVAKVENHGDADVVVEQAIQKEEGNV